MSNAICDGCGEEFDNDGYCDRDETLHCACGYELAEGMICCPYCGTKTKEW